MFGVALSNWHQFERRLLSSNLFCFLVGHR